MSNPIPASLLSLATPQNGTTADASLVASDLTQLQTDLNQIITALSGGVTGQFLKAADGTDVVWESAASLVAAGEQDFTGAIGAPVVIAQQLTGGNTATATVVGGVFTMSSSVMELTGTDSSLVTTINGRLGKTTLLLVRNAAGAVVPFGPGGGTSGFLQTFAIPNGGYALLFYDTSQSGGRWVCLSVSTATSAQYRGALLPLAYGTTVQPNAAYATLQTVTITNGTAFTLANPLNPPGSGETQDLFIEIFNNSGGSHGTITCGAAFLNLTTIASGSIANGKKEMFHFRWNGTGWVLLVNTPTGY